MHTCEQSMTSRDHVFEGVNAGASLFRDALNLGDRDDDLLILVVNTALTRLDQPDEDFDDVVNANYTDTPSEVREWWDR
jgi:hypothetical protein